LILFPFSDVSKEWKNTLSSYSGTHCFTSSETELLDQ